MIDALIVDDEQPARDELRYLIARHDEVNVVGEASDGEQALEMVREDTPDLLFLDVQMPMLNGFELVAKLLEEDLLPHVILVTAYDEYAIRAFEVNAVDYLLKPVDAERLQQAVARVRSRIEADENGHSAMVAAIAQIRDRGGPEGASERPPRLSVKKGDRYLLLDPGNVTHAYILDGVVFLATGETAGMTSHRTLDELERDLEPGMFWRVHRSYIVNIAHVAEVIPAQSGTYRLRLDDEKGTTIPLSRAQAKSLRKVLKW